MKILLINNHTVHIKSLKKELAGHQVEIQTYQPGLKFNDQNKDLVILSGGGGEGLEIHDYDPESGNLWYHDEMEFIRTTKKPVLGICMGFEVIARAYGAPITPIGKMVSGPADVQTLSGVAGAFGHKALRQYEAHRWRVEDLPPDFKVLATSKTGIEMFSYKNLLATQFHPEKGGTLKMRQLLSAIV